MLYYNYLRTLYYVTDAYIIVQRIELVKYFFKEVKKMFYDCIKKICDEKGISLWDLTNAAGMSRSNVTNWKRGASPKFETSAVTKLQSQIGVLIIVI